MTCSLCKGIGYTYSSAVGEEILCSRCLGIGQDYSSASPSDKVLCAAVIITATLGYFLLMAAFALK